MATTKKKLRNGKVQYTITPAKRAAKKVRDVPMEKNDLELAYEKGFLCGKNDAIQRMTAYEATFPKKASWQSSEAATRPGLYMLLGHEGDLVVARLTLRDNGAEKALAFFDATGAEAKSHCIKSVYGPIEEPQ